MSPAEATDGPALTYAAVGVDVAAGDRAVELMRAAVASTHAGVLAPVVPGAGGFAGLVDLEALRGMRRPLLATSTDGVGTKLAVARALDVHDTVGVDLVAMVVDDLVACGARPLALTDYVACGRLVPERIAAIVSGVAAGCRLARCPLVAGETAEHPGLLAPDEYDLAGAATGVVEADELLGPERVRQGDGVVALASSGLHANGYSLARAVVARAGWSWSTYLPELSRPVGEELLEPTRVYAGVLADLPAAGRSGLAALAHVTGGGLAANLARVLPAGAHVDVDRSTWRPPPVFGVLGDAGRVPVAEREATWNQGVGMLAVARAGAVDDLVRHLATVGIAAWQCGTVTQQDEDVLADPATVRGTKGVSGGSVRLVAGHAG